MNISDRITSSPRMDEPKSSYGLKSSLKSSIKYKIVLFFFIISALVILTWFILSFFPIPNKDLVTMILGYILVIVYIVFLFYYVFSVTRNI